MIARTCLLADFVSANRPTDWLANRLAGLQ